MHTIWKQDKHVDNFIKGYSLFIFIPKFYMHAYMFDNIFEGNSSDGLE